MKKTFFFLFFLLSSSLFLQARSRSDSLLPVRGLCIAAPTPAGLDSFIYFIDHELVPRHVNTLVIRIGYRYQFRKRPELTDDNALSEKAVKRIVRACREGGIRVIPLINMLGHQSWYSDVNKLLEVYPQFNETPWVPLDQGIHSWPNKWELYCLSYCPLHPDLHKVIFDVIDEITEVFESDAFHAGMDEVFYIGMDERCKGRDPAELFAGEVRAIHDHLACHNKEMWIWGDRLLDGRSTGMGEWDASVNNTWRAIDMIPKDVVINDWHYTRPYPTAAYFAIKGFRVITCPYRLPEVALEQLHLMKSFRRSAPDEMRDRYQGIMETVWTSAEEAISQFYGRQSSAHPRGGDWVKTFKAIFDETDRTEPKP
jgi:hypothetical protein